MASPITPLWRASPNHAARVAAVDMVVLHYTDMVGAEGAMSWLCNPESGVSAHYVIAADGALFQLVPEARTAWHAGISYWRGVRTNNDRSIGIELDSPGHRGGIAPTFPDAQIDALLTLLAGIRTRHTVPTRNVVAHSDIAPHRKLDPGEAFPWGVLADAGHALRAPALTTATGAPLVERAAFVAALSAIGYAPADARTEDIFGPLPKPGSTISAPGGPTVPSVLPSAQDGELWQAVCDAFHRRFRPPAVGRDADAGSLAIATALARTLEQD